MRLNIIISISEKVRHYFPKVTWVILFALIVACLIFFSVIKQVGKYKSGPAGWVRIGCDDNNSNFYSNFLFPPAKSQSRLASKKSNFFQSQKQYFNLIWAAEEFSPIPFRLVGGMQKLYYNLRTCDLNSDGKLEIIIGYQNQTLVLNSAGIFQYALPACFDVYQDAFKKIYTVSCSSNTIRYSSGRKEIRKLRTLNPIVSIRIARLKNRTESKIMLLTVEKLVNEKKAELFQISCYGTETGQQLWLYQFELLPFISAIGDINQDGRNEIICTTYSPDRAFGEVIALSSSGKLIWRVTFDYQYNPMFVNYKVAAYTEAAIADLDGDNKQEVVAIFGTEDGSAGRIKIIEGKTGKVIDQYPKNRFLRRAFTSLGVADLNHDGKSDIVTATRGITGRFYSFQMGTTGLETLATRRYFPPFVREPSFVSTWVWALADIDEDNEIEILGSVGYELPLFTDWTIRTTQFLEPGLVVFDARLRERTYIDLDEHCLALIVSDLIKGGANEILILANQLSLYALR